MSHVTRHPVGIIALAVAGVIAGAAGQAAAKTTVTVSPPAGPGDLDGIQALYDAAGTPNARVVLEPGTYYLRDAMPIVVARKTDLVGETDAVVRLADGTLVAATDADRRARVAVIVGAGLSADDAVNPQAAVRALGDNVIEKIAVLDSSGDAAILLEDSGRIEGCWVEHSLNRGIELDHYNSSSSDVVNGRRSHVLLTDNLARGGYGGHGYGFVVKNESRLDLPAIEDTHWVVTMHGNRASDNIAGLTTEHVANANDNSIQLVSEDESFSHNQLGVWIIGALFGANRNTTEVSLNHARITNNFGDLSNVLSTGVLVLGSQSYWDAPWAVNTGNQVRVNLTRVTFANAESVQNGTYNPWFGIQLRADVIVAAYAAWDYYPALPSTANTVKVLMRENTSDDLPGGPSSVIAVNSTWNIAFPELGAAGDTTRFIGSRTAFAASNRGLNPVDPKFYEASAAREE